MGTEVQWEAAQVRARRLRKMAATSGALVVPGAVVLAFVVANATARGPWRYVVLAAALVALIGPFVAILVRITEKEQRRSDQTVRGLTEELADAIATADREAVNRSAQARRQQFESRLSNALDMAEGEPEVVDVIERSFNTVLPGAPVELLLADNSRAHLIRMASVAPDGAPPSCPVDSPDHCPAARRAQTQSFSDSEALDACPKLRNRPQGPCSAVCVPVSIMGRTVGVIHATGPIGAATKEDQVQDLATLAKLAGARIGLLRVIAETQLQAATDTLTGLLNRRAFDQKLTSIRDNQEQIAVAMADLDHFKQLNDTYGHETGDRALRLFARVVRDSLRANDLVARFGGEEFAIAFPSCSTADASRALEGLRARLDAAVTVGGLPKFTASFGVTATDSREDLVSALSRADSALFAAKRQGRDRIVIHDPDEHTERVGGRPGVP